MAAEIKVKVKAELLGVWRSADPAWRYVIALNTEDLKVYRVHFGDANVEYFLHTGDGKAYLRWWKSGRPGKDAEFTSHKFWEYWLLQHPPARAGELASLRSALKFFCEKNGGVPPPVFDSRV